jgi:hypothetical protein
MIVDDRHIRTIVLGTTAMPTFLSGARRVAVSRAEDDVSEKHDVFGGEPTDRTPRRPAVQPRVPAEGG